MRKSKDRIGYSRSVAQLVPRVGRRAFRRFGFAESSVVARWPEIVGPEYAAHSAPESLKFPFGQRSNGTLTLAVEGAYALTIQHVEPQIIARVNRFFGYKAVARISIRQGLERSTPPVAREVAVRAEHSVAGAIPDDVAGSLKAIDDDALRNSLEDLARQISRTTGPPKIK